MRAADRDRVDMDDTPAGEHADGRRTGAEIDQRRAHLDFVVDQGRQAGRVRRRHHRGDAEVAALDRQHQVARRGGVAGGDVHFGAEFVADHPLGVAYAGGAVEPEAGRRGVQHGAAGVGARRRSRFEDAMDFALADRLAAQRDLGVEQLRRQPAARHVDDDAVDLDPRHPFGGVDRQADRVLGGVEIDNRAGLDAARTLMADAEHAAAMAALRQRSLTPRSASVGRSG